LVHSVPVKETNLAERLSVTFCGHYGGTIGFRADSYPVHQRERQILH
jgi:hypothetical protein